jgi:hypothetical protein
MTRFTVMWHGDARNELAELWMAAPDRGAVSAAADSIDLHLSTDATAKGTSIPDALRQFTVPPLRVLFAVSEADRTVRILEVSRL